MLGRLLASAASEASSAGLERRQRAPGEVPVDETVQGVSGGGGGAWRSRGKEEREGRVAARPRIGRRLPSVAAALHEAPGQRIRPPGGVLGSGECECGEAGANGGVVRFWRGAVLLSPRTGARWTRRRAAGARLGRLGHVRAVAGVPWVRAARPNGRGASGAAASVRAARGRGARVSVGSDRSSRGWRPVGRGRAWRWQRERGSGRARRGG